AKASFSKATGSSSAQAWRTLACNALSTSSTGAVAVKVPPQFLAMKLRTRCARLPKLLASSALLRLTIASGDQLPSWPKLNSRSRKRSEEHTSELQSRENLVCRL